MSFSVDIHQRIAFSKYFIYTSNDSDNIFMPGCSMLSLGYANIIPLYTILKRAYPDMAIATFCCGKPSVHIKNGKDFIPRLAKLDKYLGKNIFTSCPNCYNVLKSQGANVISIWTIIDEFIREPDVKHRGGSYTLHDPCTAKKMTESHNAVRSILKKCDVTIHEFDKCRDRAGCCGKINMTMVLDKERGTKILQSRLNGRKTDSIISYCASCTESFDVDAIESFHISDLLCEKKSNYSSKNRFHSVKYIRNMV